MFHWPLEFPEVIVKRGGFDAFVGNPPFLGGTRISTEISEDFLSGLRVLWGARNRTDLCAYFFLQAFRLLNARGFLGLIATNTIAQGDTRESSLLAIEKLTGRLVWVMPTFRWPGEAALTVSVLVIAKMPWAGKYFLDNQEVKGISTFLTSEDKAEEPSRLVKNAGMVFQGTKIYGSGFLLSPQDAALHLKQHPEEAAVVMPYLIGDDVNSRPDISPSRFVINFFDRSLHEAQQFPHSLAIVLQQVKPETR